MYVCRGWEGGGRGCFLEHASMIFLFTLITPSTSDTMTDFRASKDCTGP